MYTIQYYMNEVLNDFTTDLFCLLIFQEKKTIVSNGDLARIRRYIWLKSSGEVGFVQ